MLQRCWIALALLAGCVDAGDEGTVGVSIEGLEGTSALRFDLTVLAEQSPGHFVETLRRHDVAATSAAHIGGDVPCKTGVGRIDLAVREFGTGESLVAEGSATHLFLCARNKRSKVTLRIVLAKPGGGFAGVGGKLDRLTVSFATDVELDADGTHAIADVAVETAVNQSALELVSFDPPAPILALESWQRGDDVVDGVRRRYLAQRYAFAPQPEVADVYTPVSLAWNVAGAGAFVRHSYGVTASGKPIASGELALSPHAISCNELGLLVLVDPDVVSIQDNGLHSAHGENIRVVTAPLAGGAYTRTDYALPAPAVAVGSVQLATTPSTSTFALVLDHGLTTSLARCVASPNGAACDRDADGTLHLYTPGELLDPAN